MLTPRQERKIDWNGGMSENVRERQIERVKVGKCKGEKIIEQYYDQLSSKSCIYL